MSSGSDRKRIVSREAAYWYCRCVDEPRMPRADRRKFVAWTKRSPENIAEFLRIADVDGHFAGRRLLDRSGVLNESNIIACDFGGGVKQHDYQPSDTVSDKVARQAKTPSIWRSAAGFVILGVTIAIGSAVFSGPRKGVVETVASEWQHMTLDDGTVVHMDARTRLKIEMSVDRRIINLSQGQAAFDVAKDAQRPFVVKTPLADVIAVGTRFSVSLDRGVTTTVEEGVVKVIPQRQEDSPPILLRQDEQLQIPVAKVLFSERDKVKVDAKRELQWTSGWINFEGATVGEMVEQFNRRHMIQAVIESPQVRNHRLRYARVKIDSVDKFRQALDNEEGVAVIEDRATKTLRLLPE